MSPVSGVTGRDHVAWTALNWLDDLLYLPEVLYVLFFILLICSGPGRFSVDHWLAGRLRRRSLLDRMRCACELAHPFEPPGAVFAVEPHDVFSGVSDERPLRDDGIALRLTGVQDDACAFIAGDEAQQAD